MLVIDPALVDLPVGQTVVESLREHRIEFELYDRIDVEPTDLTFQQAAQFARAGRFDAYIESGVRLWDIAAGGLILECAGGEFWNEALEGDHAFSVIASNGLLRKKLMAV